MAQKKIDAFFPRGKQAQPAVAPEPNHEDDVVSTGHQPDIDNVHEVEVLEEFEGKS